MGKGEDLTCVLCSTFSSIMLLRLSCVSHVRLCATLTLTLTHRWQSTRLPRLWDSPGKNTGVGCHFLLQCMKVKSESEVAQSCLTLSDPMDCSPPGSSVHGIFQARVLEWGAIAFSNNPTTEHIPWENHNWKRHMYPSVCCNSRTWKQPTCPLIEVWIKKLQYT